jgi:hypothetical protein
MIGNYANALSTGPKKNVRKEKGDGGKGKKIVKKKKIAI